MVTVYKDYITISPFFSINLFLSLSSPLAMGILQQLGATLGSVWGGKIQSRVPVICQRKSFQHCLFRSTTKGREKDGGRGHVVTSVLPQQGWRSH